MRPKDDDDGGGGDSIALSIIIRVVALKMFPVRVPRLILIEPFVVFSVEVLERKS